MRLMTAPLLVVALLASRAPAATTPDDPFFGLRQPESLRVAFTQEKRIPGIERTLKASGHLVFSRQLGAIWRIEQPRPRETVLPVGKRDASAAESEVNATITSTLSGDLEALRRHFDIASTPAPDGGGLITLKPRNAAVRDVISGVALRISGQAIREIRLEEASGGVIELTFSSPQFDYKLTEADTLALKPAGR